MAGFVWRSYPWRTINRLASWGRLHSCYFGLRVSAMITANDKKIARYEAQQQQRAAAAWLYAQKQKKLTHKPFWARFFKVK